MSYGEVPCLLDARDDLAADRTIRIIPLDQVEKMRRDRERQLCSGKQDAAAFFVRKLKVLFELGERGHPVFQLPFPIIPEFGRHLGPITRRMRDELLPIHFALGKSDHFLLWSEMLMALTIVSTEALFGAPRTLLFHAPGPTRARMRQAANPCYN